MPGAKTPKLILAALFACLLLCGRGVGQLPDHSARADQPRKEVRISEITSRNRLVRCVQPIYPEEAKRRGIAGSVVLDVTVNEHGSVTALRLVSGNEILAKAAITAVRQWIYDPYPPDHPREFKTRGTFAFAPPAN